MLWWYAGIRIEMCVGSHIRPGKHQMTHRSSSHTKACALIFLYFQHIAHFVPICFSSALFPCCFHVSPPVISFRAWALAPARTTTTTILHAPNPPRTLNLLKKFSTSFSYYLPKSSVTMGMSTTNKARWGRIQLYTRLFIRPLPNYISTASI